MSRIIVYIVLLVAVVGGGLYYQYDPTLKFKREAQQVLDSLSSAVETQDRTQIAKGLSAAMAETAQIKLEIHFPSPGGQKAPDMTAQNFTKAEFLSFIDNVLYSLKDYHLKASIDTFKLSSDKSMAAVTFVSKANAADLMGITSGTNMRFAGDSTCNAQIIYAVNESPKLGQLSCVTEVHYAIAH